MERITLKDAQFRIIGYVDVESNGNITLRDPQFRILGYYKANQNVTQDNCFRIVGRGDILTSLLR